MRVIQKRRYTVSTTPLETNTKTIKATVAWSKCRFYIFSIIFPLTQVLLNYGTLCTLKRCFYLETIKLLLNFSTIFLLLLNNFFMNKWKYCVSNFFFFARTFPKCLAKVIIEKLGYIALPFS